MNYIELINQFWRLNEEHSFNTTEVAVYFYLLSICNKRGWKNPFTQSNGYIINALNISEPTLIRVRNNLKQFGLIDFKSERGRRHQTIYSLKYLNGLSINVSNSADDDKTLNNLSIPVSIPVSIVDSIPVSIPVENSLDYNKHININKTKTEDEEEPTSPADSPGSVTNEDAKPPPPDPAPPPTPPNQFTDVEQLLEECMKDRMFYEQVCMSLHMEVDRLRQWLEAFNRDLLFSGMNRKLPRDYRTHFKNWIRHRDLGTKPEDYSPITPKNDDKRNNEGKQSTAGKQSAARANLADRLRKKVDQP